MARKSEYVVWLGDVDKDDVALVGGKGANLGEMVQNGFPVPNGFIVTAKAYYAFIRENNLTIKIKHLLKTVNFQNADSLLQVSSHIKKEILDGHIPTEIVNEVFDYYSKLSGIFGDCLVAVRSSATAEDLPQASFAGQQETYLNIRGESNVILKMRKAWASLFDARALFYRHEKHFEHFKVGIAVPVQKMVLSQKSGVMFTIDPLTSDKTKIVIEAIYGLGEYIVGGKVTPDHYEVSKHDLSILSKTISEQLVLLKKGGANNKQVRVSKHDAKQQKITDKQIKEIARLGKKLERHYYFPQDVEWAIEKNKIYLVQTRPVTTIKSIPIQSGQNAQSFKLQNSNLKLLVTGSPASPGIATGPARVINSAKEIGKVIFGDVLVAPQTNPDFVPAMKKAVAIVTDTGGRTSHAAIVSREIGIPAIVGAQKATKILKTGQVITVDGLSGQVYRGGIQNSTLRLRSGREFKIQNLEPEENQNIKTATKVYVNLAEPEFADRVALKNVDGVGLLRAEFMIAGIGTHPKKLIKDAKQRLFIQTMADGIGKFAKAFYPRPVVYRASDFKTNEYRQLIGGKSFEPFEPNPMLGFRGAFRYIADPRVFELELEAIKIVRNKMDLKNLWLMLPFVRTVKELIEVKKIISSAGLFRSNSFKLWMMVEIPSNIILLDKFIYVGIDGISIGSNDLTMLLLGTDRDNSEVAREFDEQNEAVLWAFENVIKTAHKHKISSSICGQAPSLYPSLVEKLVRWGITSVSVSPDAIDQIRQTISECEKKFYGGKY